MKRMLLLLCIGTLIILLNGCAGQVVTAADSTIAVGEETDILREHQWEFPRLYANFMAEGLPTQRIRAVGAHTSWSVYLGDGYFYAIHTDSLPPSMWRESYFRDAMFFSGGSIGEFEFFFEYHYQPDYVSLTRLSIVDDNVYIEGEAEYIDIDGGILHFNNYGHCFTYIIDAVWLWD